MDAEFFRARRAAAALTEPHTPDPDWAMAYILFSAWLMGAVPPNHIGILVAHNAAFDMRILVNRVLDLKTSLPTNVLLVLDTLALVKAKFSAVHDAVGGAATKTKNDLQTVFTRITSTELQGDARLHDATFDVELLVKIITHNSVRPHLLTAGSGLSTVQQHVAAQLAKRVETPPDPADLDDYDGDGSDLEDSWEDGFDTDTFAELQRALADGVNDDDGDDEEEEEVFADSGGAGVTSLSRSSAGGGRGGRRSSTTASASVARSSTSGVSASSSGSGQPPQWNTEVSDSWFVDDGVDNFTRQLRHSHRLVDRGNQYPTATQEVFESDGQAWCPPPSAGLCVGRTFNMMFPRWLVQAICSSTNEYHARRTFARKLKWFLAHRVRRHAERRAARRQAADEDDEQPDSDDSSDNTDEETVLKGYTGDQIRWKRLRPSELYRWLAVYMMGTGSGGYGTRMKDWFSKHPLRGRSELRNLAARGGIGRARFLLILKYLHANKYLGLMPAHPYPNLTEAQRPSSEDASDRWQKIRPFMDTSCDIWRYWMAPGRYLTVDESMIPFRGRHSDKVCGCFCTNA